MTRQVTVNLFEVQWTDGKTQKLSSTLNEYMGLPLGQRWRGDFRLDRVEREAADNIVPHPAFHLDFARQREIGPGRLSANSEIKDVSLEVNENFGEETSALYLPTKKWLLVLNNQFGVGPNRMAEYFNALDPGNHERHFDYSVSAYLDNKVMEKMRAMKRFSEIEISANVGAFSNAADSISESVTEAAAGAKAARLYVKLCANEPHKKGGALDPGKIKAMIKSLLSSEDAVDKINVRGGDAAINGKDQLLQLIEHKVKLQFPETELEVVKHRYSYTSRIRVLRRACRAWLDTLG